MKFFITGKAGTDVFKAESKEALIQRMQEAGVNPSDFVIQTPEEYQQERIKEARLAEYPVLSKMFPRTANKYAETGETPLMSRTGSDDYFSLLGRGYAAFADAALGDGKFKDDFMQSLGEAKADDRERGVVGGFAQDILRDSMLLPGSAIPGGGYLKVASKVAPKIASKIPKASSGIAAFFTNNVVKPAMDGAVAGTISGLLRPLATTDESRLDDDILSGAIASPILRGAGKGAGSILEYIGAKRMSQAKYDKLVNELAQKNHVPHEYLREAATPGGRANMKKHFKTEADIAEDIINYKGFDESQFPEYKTYEKGLKRSQTRETSPESVDVINGYEQRAREIGGILTDDIELSASEKNYLRKKIGSMLENDFRKIETGLPDAGKKELKKVYGILRGEIMDILRRDGEHAALEAYKKMGDKLKSRDALFQALRISKNEYQASDRLASKLGNIYGNQKRDKTTKYLKNFDEAFGENFSERIKWNNIANRLGVGDNNTKFMIPGENPWFAGKGAKGLVERAKNRFTGGTVHAALNRLEKARPSAITRPPHQINGYIGSRKPQNIKEQKAHDEIMQRAHEVASMYGKPGDKKYDEAYYHHIATALNAEAVPAELVGSSTQKRKE
jgi:hypothetical protein